MAGLLTCGSLLVWAFPLLNSGVIQHRYPLTVAGAVAELAFAALRSLLTLLPDSVWETIDSFL